MPKFVLNFTDRKTGTTIEYVYPNETAKRKNHTNTHHSCRLGVLQGLRAFRIYLRTLKIRNFVLL